MRGRQYTENPLPEKRCQVLGHLRKWAGLLQGALTRGCGVSYGIA
jgi:hypothetical protein